MSFFIKSTYNDQYTILNNRFIAEHMIPANGNYVKVFLLLQMASQNKDALPDLSVGALADLLECTENDILRALRYWDKHGLISLEQSGDEILSLTIGSSGAPETGTSSHFSPEAAASLDSASISDETISIPETPVVSEVPAEPVSRVTEETSLPPRQNYSPLQAEAFSNDVEIKKTITTVEQLLGTTISPSHLQNILYFMCDVGFSSDLVCAMYETAVNKGKKQVKYIEAIDINWAKKGIKTREEALTESQDYNTAYLLVRKAFGFKRSLAPAETTIVDEWCKYNFDSTILEEACKRTVLQTGETNFHYAGSILKKWHEQNVTCLQDIEKQDQAFKEKKKEKKEKPRSHGRNQFNQFPQRDYSQKEVSSLEKQLLQGNRS